jgi:predicted SprT family Zn-dependent metalloprotease
MIITFNDFINEKIVHKEFGYDKESERFYILSKGKWIFFVSKNPDEYKSEHSILQIIKHELDLDTYPDMGIIDYIRENRPDIICLDWEKGSSEVEYSNTDYYFTQNVMTSKELMDTLSYLKTNLNIHTLTVNSSAFNENYETTDTLNVTNLLSDYKKMKDKKLSPTVFHGTCTYYLDSILKYGLSPTHGSSNFSDRGVNHSRYLFFSSNFVDCIYYANNAANQSESIPIILAIDTSEMDKTKITFDYDFYTNYIQHGVPEFHDFDWTHLEMDNPPLKHLSGKYMGSVFGKFAYKGKLYPKWIKTISYKRTPSDSFDEWVGKDKFKDFQELVWWNRDLGYTKDDYILDFDALEEYKEQTQEEQEDVQVERKISTFNQFVNEKFEFEYDIKEEFDRLNELLFDNEVIYPEISFDPHKTRVAWVSFKDGVVLHFNKNYSLTPEQFKNTLAHEMIHILLYQRKIMRDYGGDHGIYFTREMDRINNMNVGIKISPKNDTLTPFQQRQKKEKEFYVIFFNWKDEKILCPFSVKEECEKFWDIAMKSFKISSPKDLTIYMAKTTLNEINFYSVARAAKNVKQYRIPEELYQKLLSESEILRKETVTR